MPPQEYIGSFSNDIGTVVPEKKHEDEFALNVKNSLCHQPKEMDEVVKIIENLVMIDKMIPIEY
jgi:hypothetical protein